MVVVANDRDHDGVADDKDLCPDVPAGSVPDAKKPGCPSDRDGDGVIDVDDACVDDPAGPHPDKHRPGCPSDRDNDGVFDTKDQCPDVPAGTSPDPARPGCPVDTDKDTIPDAVDACPDKPGAPDPNPKKNGCPSVLVIRGDQIVIFQQVMFATNKDLILPKSFPLMFAIAAAVKSLRASQTLVVEGHTDDKGKPAKNFLLSQKRAEAVKKWLVAHGCDGGRIIAKGLGPSRPLVPNKNEAMRAKNRRVELHILQAP
jgi:outer membrane protein OmpA-like peptidoglycan-associated protein